MKRWVRIQKEWYELLGIGTVVISVLTGSRVMILPKIIVDGYKLA